MKLHKVSIKNINSLYGSHEIDFDGALASSPLFLIVGPTGSGKSTVMDAICLAMFGQTPRLSKKTGSTDQDPVHVMSHGTGNCEASVEFSKRNHEGDRERFRATWSCRRARDKPGGNAQPPIRTLVRMHDDGKEEEVLISDNRAKFFGPPFNQVLEGLTVDDFKRSVLLAQGEFAAFLKASESVKASILERLTSTDEYKRIGQRAALKRREVDSAYRALMEKLDHVELLSTSDEQDLLDSLKHLQEELEKKQKEQDDIEGIASWLLHERELTERLAGAQEALQEVEKSLSARAQDLAMFDEDQRVRPAEHDLRTFLTLTARHEKLQAEITSNAQALEALLNAREKAQHELTTRQDTLDVAQKAQDEAAPVLREGERLSARLSTLEEERQHIQLKVATATQTVLDIDTQSKQLGAQHNQAQDALTRADDVLTQSAHLSTLGEALGKMDAQRQTLVDNRAQQRALLDKLTELSTAQNQAQAKLELHHDKVAQTKAKLAPQKHALSQAQDVLASQLSGHETMSKRNEQLQQALDRGQTRAHTAAQLHDLFATMKDLESQTTHIEKQTEEQRESELILKRDLEASEQERTQSKHLVETLDRAIATLDVQLALSQKRKNLSKDDQCPLCGSEDHPMLEHGEEPEALEAQLVHKREQKLTRRQAATQGLQAVERECHDTEVKLIQLRASLEHETQRVDELRTRTAKALEKFNAHWTTLEKPALQRFPAKAAHQGLVAQQVDQLHKTFTADVAQTRASIDALRAAQRDVDQAKEALAQGQASIDTHEQDAAHLDKHVAVLSQQHVDTHNASSALTNKLTSQDIELRTLFSTFKLDWNAELAEQSMSKARTAWTDRQAQESQTQRLREDVKALEQSVQRMVEALGRAQTAKKEAMAQHKAKEDVLNQTSSSLKTLFPEDTPATRRAALETTMRTARDLRESAQSVLANAREVAASAASAQASRQTQFDEVSATLATTTNSLNIFLTRFELKDVQELEAKLLSPARRAELQETLDALRRARSQARVNLEATQSLSDEHQTKAPEHENLRKRSTQDWETLLQDGKTALASQREDVGMIKQQINQQDDAKLRVAQYQEELDELSTQRNTWETIGKLIGGRDGETFKQFAQSLNLQQMVDRANARLASLAPRYRLVVATGDQGEPRLDFAVRDTHQAGVERPLTTLSGGETFLVSLALALALADFKRIDMPVETLLLDEGFGTLDQDTLDAAINTLRQLQHTSAQQIGIISHVTSLRERIDSRIVVEKLGNGRSTLHVEVAGKRVRKALEDIEF